MSDRVPVTVLQRDRLARRRRRDEHGLLLPVPHSVGGALIVDRQLDRDRLAAAVRTVAGRHPALRVRIGTGAGGPCQVFGDTVPIGTLSFGADLAKAAFDHLDQWCGQEFATGGHLFEAAIGVTGTATALLLCADQLVADLWSVRILLGKVAAAYRSPATVGPDDGYADLVRRELAWLESPDGREQRRQSAGLARSFRRTPLPGPAGQPPAAATVTQDRPAGDPLTVRSLAVAGDDLRQLRARCRRLRTTVGTVLSSAVGSSVANAIGEPEVTVMVVFAGRDNPDWHDVVAARTNTLPVLVPATRGGSLDGIVRTVHRANFAAMARQSVPWPVIRHDHPGTMPDTGTGATFADVAVQYIPAGLMAPADERLSDCFDGATVDSRFGGLCPAGAGLDVLVGEAEDRLHIAFLSAPALVDPGFVDGVVQDVSAALAHFGSEPSH